MANRVLVSLFEHKAWANRSMFETLGAVPEEKRGAIGMPLLVLNHAALVDQVFKARLLGEEPTLTSIVPNRMPVLDALRETVRATDAWYVDYVSTVTDAELAQVVAFKFLSDDDAGRMTKEEMLLHVLTHGQSHRAQVGQMLDAASIKGAPDMFTTFLRRSR